MLGIAMTMLLGTAVLGVDLAHSAKNAAKSARFQERGVMKPSDPELHSRLWQDFSRDFLGGRKFFPEDVVPYLAKNKKALSSYTMALCWEEERRRGLYPYGYPCEIYDERSFDPFCRFNANYKAKIKTYNETGVYYY